MLTRFDDATTTEVNQLTTRWLAAAAASGGRGPATQPYGGYRHATQPYSGYHAATQPSGGYGHHNDRRRDLPRPIPLDGQWIIWVPPSQRAAMPTGANGGAIRAALAASGKAHVHAAGQVPGWIKQVIEADPPRLRGQAGAVLGTVLPSVLDVAWVAGGATLDGGQTAIRLRAEMADDGAAIDAAARLNATLGQLQFLVNRYGRDEMKLEQDEAAQVRRGLARVRAEANQTRVTVDIDGEALALMSPAVWAPLVIEFGDRLPAPDPAAGGVAAERQHVRAKERNARQMQAIIKAIATYATTHQDRMPQGPTAARFKLLLDEGRITPEQLINPIDKQRTPARRGPDGTYHVTPENYSYMLLDHRLPDWTADFSSRMPLIADRNTGTPQKTASVWSPDGPWQGHVCWGDAHTSWHDEPVVSTHGSGALNLPRDHLFIDEERDNAVMADEPVDTEGPQTRPTPATRRW